jgi:hypothetical protein
MKNHFRASFAPFLTATVLLCGSFGLCAAEPVTSPTIARSSAVVPAGKGGDW